MVALVGMASWYSVADNGTTTASGIPFSDHKNTCAHRTHKFGTKLQVTNTRNGKTTTCVVTDRGPYIKGRVVDLSPVGAAELGMKSSGLAPIQIAVVTDPYLIEKKELPSVDHQPQSHEVGKSPKRLHSKALPHRGKLRSPGLRLRPETSVRDVVLNSLRNLHSI
jgi:rare lipoprotein A